MKKATIKIDDIKKSFKQGPITTEVLKGISYTFEQGQTYALTGSSGAGKSTLIHIIGGLDEPTVGQVFLNDIDIANISAEQKEIFFSDVIGLVFQQPYLIKELSVLENVMLKGLIENEDRKLCKQRGQELLDSVGLGDKGNYRPSALSGGQQQRIALARALFNKPAFLIADEPTGNLDEATGASIVDLLLEYQKEWGMGIIICSHDAYVAQRMEHNVRLHDGKLVA